MSPLLRFHLTAGSRVALREQVPVVALLLAGGGFLGRDSVVALAGLLFPPQPAPAVALVPAIVLGVLLAAVARVATERLLPAARGWIRHLPTTGIEQRRALWLAVGVAQTPLLVVLALLAALAPRRDPAALLVDLVGLALVALGCGLAVLPTASRLSTSPLAMVAALLAAGGGAPPHGVLAIAASGAMLLIADRLAGSISSRPAARGRRSAGSAARRRGHHPGALRLRPIGLWVELARRAVGIWGLLLAYAQALIPLGLGALFVANNRLEPHLEPVAHRLAGGSAVVVLLACLAARLGTRRPVWAWSRSLPWSARTRAGYDAATFLAGGLPLLLLVGRLGPATLVTSGSLLLYLSGRAAGALRRPPGRRLGPGTVLLLEGSLAAGILTLLPWSGLACLALAPLAIGWGAWEESRLKLTSFDEHRLAPGGSA